MSVTATLLDAQLTPIQFPVRADGLLWPIGFWFGQSRVTGDSSGGWYNLYIRLHGAPATLGLWSCEAHSYKVGESSVGHDGTAYVTGNGPNDNTGNEMQWNASMVDIAIGGSSADATFGRADMLRRQWPPLVQRAGVQLAVAVLIERNTNLVEASFSAWGWQWDGAAFTKGFIKPRW